MTARRRIDVHHHAIPRAFVEEATARGVTHVAGAPLPKWNAERSLAVMDGNDIETALLSLSSPKPFSSSLATRHVVCIALSAWAPADARRLIPMDAAIAWTHLISKLDVGFVRA